MSRKPVHLTHSRKKPSGRQAIWQAIRELRIFTVTNLAEACHQDRDTTMTYVKSLTRGGYLTLSGTVTAPSKVIGVPQNPANRSYSYELVRDVGITAPRVKRDGTPVVQGRMQEQMWQAMRMLPSAWSKIDLSIAASTDDVAVSEVDAHHYIKHLNGAGYLRVVVANNGPHSLAQYRLVKNTGPRAPMIQRLKTVFDPNLGEIVWNEQVDE